MVPRGDFNDVGDPGTEGGDVVAEVRRVDEVVEGRDVCNEVGHLKFKSRSPRYVKVIAGSEDAVLVQVDEGSVTIVNARRGSKRRVVGGWFNVFFLVIVRVAIRVKRSVTGVWSEGGEVLVFTRSRSIVRTKR